MSSKKDVTKIELNTPVKKTATSMRLDKIKEVNWTQVYVSYVVEGKSIIEVAESQGFSPNKSNPTQNNAYIGFRKEMKNRVCYVDPMTKKEMTYADARAEYVAGLRERVTSSIAPMLIEGITKTVANLLAVQSQGARHVQDYMLPTVDGAEKVNTIASQFFKTSADNLISIADKFGLFEKAPETKEEGVYDSGLTINVISNEELDD